MKDRISSCARAVPPSGIRKFFEMVLGMPDVISLGVGEPDFVAPWHIREACIYSLEKGYTMYTSNYGMLELREEISKAYNNLHSLHYNPESEILITTGVSEGYDLAIRALVNPGDEVLIPEPSYVSYKPCTVFACGKPVVIATKAEDEFKLTPESLKSVITSQSKVLVLNYPNNPTGATMDKKELEEIADIAVENDLIVISDEVYGKLTYVRRNSYTILLTQGYERQNCCSRWVFKGLRHDRIQNRLLPRPRGHHRCNDESPPIHNALRTHHRPDVGNRGPSKW